MIRQLRRLALAGVFAGLIGLSYMTPAGTAYADNHTAYTGEANQQVDPSDRAIYLFLIDDYIYLFIFDYEASSGSSGVLSHAVGDEIFNR